MIPVQLIGAAVIAIASFGAAWTYQGNRYEAKLAEREAAQATALAEANADALAKTVALQKAKDEAERKHQSRLADMRRDLAGNRVALVGLSHAADQALRAAHDSHSACIADANTLTIVFGKCSTRLQDVAADADGLSAEVSLLREAWPEYNPQLSKSGSASKDQELVR